MCCQISTESPNDAPSDNTTVPTITTAAIRLLVNSTMIMKIRHSEAIPAINMSYFTPSARSLNVAAVPPREMRASSSSVPLTASIAACLIGSTSASPSGDAGSLRCAMIIRTALPSGDRNIFMPRWKSGLSNTSGGR